MVCFLTSKALEAKEILWGCNFNNSVFASIFIHYASSGSLAVKNYTFVICGTYLPFNKNR